MDLLLDTHTLLWFIDGDVSLSARAKHAIEDQSNVVRVSTASLWELAIKFSLGKIKLAKGLDAYLHENVLNGNFEILEVRALHTLEVAKLPLHHKDPFDRLLIAQAVVEKVALVSIDANVAKYAAYPVSVYW